MSLALSSMLDGSEDSTFHVDCWNAYLSLATASGWEPMGTLPYPLCLDHSWEVNGLVLDPYEWSGAYDQPLLQMVEGEDALRFGEALFRVLDATSAGKELRPEQKRALDDMGYNKAGSKASVLAKIRQVAEFAKKGPFQIVDEDPGEAIADRN